MKTFRLISMILILSFFKPFYNYGQENNSISDTKFLQEAATTGMNTVALGNLGQKRLQNQELKAYAQNVLNAHMASNAKLKALAKNKAVKLPDPMTIPINSMQTRADTSAKDSSDTVTDSLTTNFDAEYLQMMIDDHKKAIDLFKKGAAVKDRDIRSYASKSLPMLRKHLNEAEKLSKAMSVK